MKKEIYNAAEIGDMKFLEEAQAIDVEATTIIYSNDDLLEVTCHGNNIIHIAAKYGHFDFIKGVLNHFQANNDHRRKLICGRNLDGDTPLHFAAKQHTPSIAELLLDNCVELAPWRIQNNKGNTPLHVALMNGGKSLKVAAHLIEVGPEVVSCTNHNQQTPLHLVVEYHSKGAKLSIADMATKLNKLRASLDYKTGFIEEDDVSLLKKLLESATIEVCCLRDKHGMTPLLRAAFNSYLSAVEAIINYCPESVEICDSKGMNILHHIKFSSFLDAKFFLSTPKICALIDQQDEDGNTPLHIAIKNCDHCMMKAMMECNANFFIKNSEGNSPASLIQGDSGSCLGKLDEITNKELLKDEIVMSKLEWYEKGVNGDWEYLRKKLEESGSENVFVSRLLDGTNIIHFALEKHIWVECMVARKIIKDFIVDVLKKFPILSCHKNGRGQTPFHYAIHGDPDCYDWTVNVEEGVLFKCIKDNFRYIKERITCFLPPWKAKDDNGNTLLHLAVFNCKHEFAKYLLDEVDADLVGEVNNSKQTPLHFLFDTSYLKPTEEMVELLLEKDTTAVHLLDVNGCTPLLTAVQNYYKNKKAIIAMLKYCPQPIRDRDPQGRNIFHYLDHIADPNDDMKNLRETIPQWEVERLLRQEDYEGNKPLDLAIQQGHYDKATAIIRFFQEIKVRFEEEVHYGINKKTKDMLVSAQIPSSFLDFLQRHPSDLTEVIGIRRSMYGVDKTLVKEYMNPMGVVAALLATVTFTAAFTVPGDYNNDGSPNLVRKALFQVFMFSDVVGMCSSMMVLFCLLWFLTSSFNIDDEYDFDERVVLVDMAISFLLISFYVTLVAFMTGVYVTTISSIPWLAIFTCVLCTLFLLSMRRGVVKIASKLLRGLPIFVKYVLPDLVEHNIPCLANYWSKIRSCCQRARRANQDRE